MSEASVRPARKAIIAPIVLAFCLGVAIAFAMMILALDFYVSIENPLLISTISIVCVAAGTWAWRNRDDRRPIWRTNLALAGGQIFVMAAAMEATLYCLMSIYPPNLGL